MFLLIKKFDKSYIIINNNENKMSSGNILMSELIKIIPSNMTFGEFIDKYEKFKIGDNQSRINKDYNFALDGFPDDVYQFLSRVYGDNSIDTDKYWEYYSYFIVGKVSYRKLKKVTHNKVNIENRLNNEYYLEYSATTPTNLEIRYRGVENPDEYGYVLLGLNELSKIEMKFLEFISTIVMIDE
jgi:hypothetical protein